ncbi:unnamed protein product [Phytophthora lilii]|uniref:Unnamed protein product n=1 Tax=Phytophthora lilii TaxID=2077276 RepID=A0A9W6X3S3_9STRA|nr:unnamed protein product [Phytophthora lilii]
MLIIGRIVTGLGVSGQLSTTVVLVQELSPSSIRGRVVSLLDAFTGIGGLFGVVLAYAVAPWLGWRTTYLAVCGFVLYTIVLHFTIPESPRWLTSIGRVEEASQIIDKIERSHCVNPPCGDFQKEVVGFTSALESPSSAAVKFGRFEQVVSTLRLWALWIVVALSSYALGIYVPTLISFNGYNMFARWETIVALCIAQVLGSLVAAAALDAYGTQRLLLSFTALAAVISIVLSYVPWSSVLVIVGSFLVTALLAGCWSCVLAYSTGRCKSAYRGRGVGYAVGVGRLASVGGCYLYPHMFNVWVFSVPTLCWIFGGALAVVPLLLVQENVANSFSWRSDTDLESGTKLEQAPSSLPSS